MTDVDKVWALCRQTKSAGSKLAVWPPTDKQSAWYQIGVELGVIGAAPPPPPPPPPVTEQPLWGFDENTADFRTAWDGVQAKPFDPANCSGASKFGSITDVMVQGVLMRRFDVPGVASGENCGATAIARERAQAIKNRTLDEGSLGVYSYVFLFPQRTTSMGTNYLLSESNAQFISSMGPTTWMYWKWGTSGPFIETGLQAGKVQTTAPAFEVNTRYVVIPEAAYLPDVQWQIVTAVQYERTASGSMEVWYRQRGATAWAKPVDVHNIKTLQQKPDGSIPANSGQDVIAAYRLKYSQPTHHYCRLMKRHKTVAGAMAYLDGR